MVPRSNDDVSTLSSTRSSPPLPSPMPPTLPAKNRCTYSSKKKIKQRQTKRNTTSQSVAKRVSEEVAAGIKESGKRELNDNVDGLGGTVGYSIRFEDQTNEHTGKSYFPLYLNFRLLRRVSFLSV
jgi:hypothetical protein